jgi:hypothetical protein
MRLRNKLVRTKTRGIMLGIFLTAEYTEGTELMLGGLKTEDIFTTNEGRNE